MAPRRYVLPLVPLATLVAALACSLTPGTSATTTPLATPARPSPTTGATVPPPSAIPSIEPTLSPATGTPVSAPEYLDDRTTPQGVILSLFNAINRREYVRGYSYWETNAQALPPYPQFEQGYQDTASVQVTIGTVGGDAGAGQFYYTVPVVLTSVTTSGEQQTYAGCYTLHLANPGVQGAPPFQPLAIRSGTLQQEESSADRANLLAHACDDLPTGSSPALSPQPTTPATGADASVYIDDRSGPQSVLRSLVNAINRHEYVRAYGYWEAGASQLPNFDDFEQGYANTESVSLNMGTATSDQAAGQAYYLLPVALTSQMSGGSVQYFVGCYQLHLANPSFQGAPPFQPLAIQQAQVNSVSSQAEANSQLAGVCAGMP